MPRRYCCRFRNCRRRFTSRRDASIHINRKHLLIKSYRCFLCFPLEAFESTDPSEMRRHCQKKHLVEKPQVNSHWYRFGVSNEWEFHCERLGETGSCAPSPQYRQVDPETQSSTLTPEPLFYTGPQADEFYGPPATQLEYHGTAGITSIHDFSLHESFAQLEINSSAQYNSVDVNAPLAFDPEQTLFHTEATTLLPPLNGAIASLLDQVYSRGFADAQAYSAQQQAQRQTDHLFSSCSPSTSASDKCMHCWLAAYYGIPCDFH